jgi:berberine-like enzyme
VNYLDRDEDDRVDIAFADNIRRLHELERLVDPGKLLRMNHNITTANADVH